MTVKTILCRKGRDVVTIEPSAPLESAIATLAEHRIGALVVLGADGKVYGSGRNADGVLTGSTPVLPRIERNLQSYRV